MNLKPLLGFLEPVQEETPWSDYKDLPSMAVVAANSNGDGIVIFYVGSDLDFTISESGSSSLMELGFGNVPTGISVWMGRYKTHQYHEGDYDSWPVGEFREPTDGEWDAIRRGQNPWNERDWKYLCSICPNTLFTKQEQKSHTCRDCQRKD